MMPNSNSGGKSPAGKSNASCTSCHRRKLKCDREVQGCHSCNKAELPCLYPSPSDATKRKRGPYQKDKTKRERELEHAVKVMESKCEQLADQVQNPQRVEAKFALRGWENGCGGVASMMPNGHQKSLSGTSTPFTKEEGQLRQWSSSTPDDDPCPRRSSADAGDEPRTEDRNLRLKNRFWSNFSNDVSSSVPLRQASEPLAHMGSLTKLMG
jgi:Fungal Zn(2)-Cys(6) binuclear cluster domain